MATKAGITGTIPVINLFKELPDRMARQTLRKSLTAAITVVGEAVKEATPVDTGLLANNAGTAVTIDTANKTGYAGFGFGPQQYVADWVERGHRIVGHKPNETDTGKHVPAHPFQGPAFDASEDEALAAFEEALNAELDAWWASGSK